MSSAEEEIALLKSLLLAASQERAAPLNHIESSLKLKLQAQEEDFAKRESALQKQIDSLSGQLAEQRTSTQLEVHRANMIEELMRNSEKISLANADAAPLPIGGWRLELEDDDSTAFVFEAGTEVPAYERLTVVAYNGDHNVASETVTGPTWKVKWFYGDRVILRNQHGVPLLVITM